MKTKDIWIKNALVITQNAQRELFQGHIEVINGCIVGLHDLETSIPTGVNTLDASGLVVMPGFIQPHIHLCQTLFRNMADDMELLDWLSKRIWPLEAAHSEESIFLSAQLGIQELLASGTTCILDMATVHHTSALLEAVRESGIRANVGKCLMDHPETSPPYLIEGTQAALNEAQAIYERWNGTENDRIRISYAPRFVVSCTEGLLREVGTLAASQGAIIHTHSSENEKEVELVRSLVGQENAAYLHHLGLMSPRLVLAHCIWLNETEQAFIRDTGTHVVHCPSSNLKLASGFARVPEMLADGINVALAADGAPCNNQLNALQEMRLAALMHKPGRGPGVMPATQVLDMITINGAKALGWQDQIGSVELGKQADLVAVDLSQASNFLPFEASALPSYKHLASALVYSTQAAQIKWTMVQGEMVCLDGQALKIPFRDIEPMRIRDIQRKVIGRMQDLIS